MKKKLLIVISVLALIPTAYTAFAWLSIRGVRIYLQGTEWGAFLSRTWFWTLLAAVVLWLPVVIALLRKLASLLRRDRDLVVPQFDTASPTQTTKGVLDPRGAGDETELLEPAVPDAAEGIAAAVPAAQSDAGETELLESVPAADETVLLPEEPAPAAAQEEPAPAVKEEPAPVVKEEPAPVMVEEPAPADGETVLLQPELPAQTSSGPKFCRNCGTPVTGRFCAKCGAQVRK